MSRPILAAALIAVVCASVEVRAQAAARTPTFNRQNESTSDLSSDRDAEQELGKGTALTRAGQFKEAIPHLIAARGRVTNEYAASFNLALCYVATGDQQHAIALLSELKNDAHNNVDVQNLLTQAYIGNGQEKAALATLENAAAISPQNEKLYVFVADACTDHQYFELGLKVVDLGLRSLPQSPRLHYQRAMFLTQLERFDEARNDFELAARLAPAVEIGFLAKAEQCMLGGDIAGALATARTAVSKGFQNPALLTIIGEALLRSGIVPGQPDFTEAQSDLERAVVARPNDPASQIALGKIYLQAGRLDDAIAHLERARQMTPNQPSVLANLAKAYQRRGDLQQAQQALAALEKLNLAHAEGIRAAPGERKTRYGGREAADEGRDDAK